MIYVKNIPTFKKNRKNKYLVSIIFNDYLSVIHNNYYDLNYLIIQRLFIIINT